MTLQRGHALAAGEIPEADGMVEARGGQRFSIRREGQRRDAAGVLNVFHVIRHDGGFLAGARVPQTDDEHAAIGKHVARGNDRLAIRRKHQRPTIAGEGQGASEEVGGIREHNFPASALQWPDGESGPAVADEPLAIGRKGHRRGGIGQQEQFLPVGRVPDL